jgi:hypothetical protein
VEASVNPTPPPAEGGVERMRPGRRYTGGGRMVVWKATEKDTWAASSEDEGEKGGGGEVEKEKAECVICFEEFEVGEMIARLECLCRYHKVCTPKVQ